MATDSSIMVRVGADIEPLKKGFKTASQRVGDFKKQAAATAKSIAAMTAGAAAAGAAVAAMANEAANAAREVKNLARVSGVGTTDFQKYAFAAKTVGIEQDKLADIFKDTNDKIGDFLATGAGPMADFFENIAPKVGVTADEFRDLSGPQALQKYVSALQAANVTQNEMTFYMEAIASDATALLPLLADGGAAFAALGEEASNAGAVLSELDIAKLDQMKTAFDKVAEVSSTGAQALAAEFAPVLGALADEFIRLRTETNNFGNANEAVLRFATKAVGVFANGLHGIRVIIKGLEVGFHAFSVGVNSALGFVMGGIDQMLNVAIGGINTLISGINKIPGLDDIPLLGGFNTGQALMEGAETAKNNLAQAAAEMQDILLAPLPSDKIEAFVAAAVETYEKAAEASVSALTGGTGNPADAPVVKATTDIVGNMRAAWDKHHAESIQALDDAEKAKADAQKWYGDQSLGAYSTLFSNLSSLMESENRNMFEIGKKAAQAQTIVDTYSAAQAAFKSLAGIPVVGPALGAAAAGAAVVAGVARLNAINATSFGSKSAPSDPGGAAVTGGGGGPAAAGGAGSAAGASSTLFVEGINPTALFTGDSVRALANELLEFQRDGGQVVLT